MTSHASTFETPNSLDRLIARLLKTAWLMRLPIGLYRIGAGWIFGSRLVMVEHLGRSSGARRFVVLECVDHPEPDLVRVASGLGPQSQWYRNLAANGVAYVSIGGRRRIPATVRILTEQESRLQLVAYGKAHPRAWRRLHSAMAAAQGREPDIRIVELAMEPA